jgi:hypothetical protein
MLHAAAQSKPCWDNNLHHLAYIFHSIKHCPIGIIIATLGPSYGNHGQFSLGLRWLTFPQTLVPAIIPNKHVL